MDFDEFFEGLFFWTQHVRLPKWRHFVVVVEVNAGRHEKFYSVPTLHLCVSR